MIPYTLRDTVKDLYTAFSTQPYTPAMSWTTTKEFKLDHQPTPAKFAADPQFEPQQHEFVLDTTFGGSGQDRTAHT